MKNLILLTAFSLISNWAFANEIVQTVVTKNNSFMTKSKEKISFSAELDWRNFDPAKDNNGYAISKAKTVRFVNPELPDGCLLTADTLGNPIQGGFDGAAAFGNKLSFILSGASCSDIFYSLKSGSFDLELTDVPRMQDASIIAPLLQLVVEN